MMTIEEQVPVWDAVNEYAESCGLDGNAISDRRMDAVVAVNNSIERLIRNRLNLMIEGAHEMSIKRDALRCKLTAANEAKEKAEADLALTRTSLKGYHDDYFVERERAERAECERDAAQAQLCRAREAVTQACEMAREMSKQKVIYGSDVLKIYDHLYLQSLLFGGRRHGTDGLK